MGSKSSDDLWDAASYMSGGREAKPSQEEGWALQEMVALLFGACLFMGPPLRTGLGTLALFPA